MPRAQAELMESFRAGVAPAWWQQCHHQRGHQTCASLTALHPCDRRKNSQKGVLADDGAFLELSKPFSSLCLAREEPAQNSSWFLSPTAK